MLPTEYFKALLLILIGGYLIACSSTSQEVGDYVCPPCNSSCDELSFKQAGSCPHCHMELIHKDELISEELVLNEISLSPGSGVFLIEGANFRKQKTIKVYYHRPNNFTSDSPVLMVIPGAGRNADSYRDAWIEKSETYGVLVLSPQYAEDQYSLEDYHLGGLIKTTNLDQSVQFSDSSNQVFLDEDQWQAELNQNSEEWLFQDFDRIFELTKGVLKHNQEQYDLFGHSAGGHILHRLALFHQSPLINRILASNASFYTITDQQTPYPFGLGGTGIGESGLRQAFSQKLVVFLGALDNEQEQGGSFLRSTTADQQGLHRLARGKYFFETAIETAKASQNEFNWKLHIVPDVGHDQSAMAAAAADYLYHK